ncbi:MAG: O-methyltransferase [Actinobacteria bacterium]|nr:O-methyltransferase [Actinomycetota bacterium]
MTEFLPEATREFLALAGPEPDAAQRAMAEHAEAASFPIIGPTVGGLLAGLASLTDARRVFEFGSGFGYSASWFARGMRDGGEVVLTEHDADELELAPGFLEEQGGYGASFTYERGDAIEIVDRHDGPFDVVLIDHEKDRYVEGLEAARGKLAPGAAVVADNMMRGPMDFEDVLAGLRGEPAPDPETAGVVEYIEHVRDDPDFDSVVLPVGSGVAVSVRRR